MPRRFVEVGAAAAAPPANNTTTTKPKGGFQPSIATAGGGIEGSTRMCEPLRNFPQAATTDEDEGDDDDDDEDEDDDDDDDEDDDDDDDEGDAAAERRNRSGGVDDFPLEHNHQKEEQQQSLHRNLTWDGTPGEEHPQDDRREGEDPLLGGEGIPVDAFAANSSSPGGLPPRLAGRKTEMALTPVLISPDSGRRTISCGGRGPLNMLASPTSTAAAARRPKPSSTRFFFHGCCTADSQVDEATEMELPLPPWSGPTPNTPYLNEYYDRRHYYSSMMLYETPSKVNSHSQSEADKYCSPEMAAAAAASATTTAAGVTPSPASSSSLWQSPLPPPTIQYESTVAGGPSLLSSSNTRRTLLPSFSPSPPLMTKNRTASNDNSAIPNPRSFTAALIGQLSEAENKGILMVTGARSTARSILEEARREAETEVQLYREQFDLEFTKLLQRHQEELDAVNEEADDRADQEIQKDKRRAARGGPKCVMYLLEKTCDVDLALSTVSVDYLKRAGEAHRRTAAAAAAASASSTEQEATGQQKDSSRRRRAHK